MLQQYLSDKKAVHQNGFNNTKYCAKKCSELVYDYSKQICTVSLYRRTVIDSYKQKDDKVRSLAATLLLDELLREYGLFERDMEYSIGEHKKPYFKNSDIFFNLSHSGEYVAAAVSEKEIGIDIEKVHTVNHNITKRFFTKKEAGYIKNNDDFFKLWVQKESFIKAIGKGLTCPLNSFEIINSDNESFVLFNNKKYSFTVNSIDDYKIAVCTEVDYEHCS